MINKAFVLIAAANVVLAASAAEVAGGVSSTLSVAKVVVDAGRDKLESAATAKPGDVLEYRVLYRNGGKSAIKHLQPTLPIPAGCELLTNGLQPQITSASLNGRDFSAAPLLRNVKNKDGSVTQQAVPLREYQFIRWSAQDLPAGAALSFTARIKIAADARTLSAGT